MAVTYKDLEIQRDSSTLEEDWGVLRMEVVGVRITHANSITEKKTAELCRVAAFNGLRRGKEPTESRSKMTKKAYANLGVE